MGRKRYIRTKKKKGPKPNRPYLSQKKWYNDTTLHKKFTDIKL